MQKRIHVLCKALYPKYQAKKKRKQTSLLDFGERFNSSALIYLFFLFKCVGLKIVVRCSVIKKNVVIDKHGRLYMEYAKLQECYQYFIKYKFKLI